LRITDANPQAVVAPPPGINLNGQLELGMPL
jgi:hypothetical protein